MNLQPSIRLGSSVGGFSPATLFSASEPGAWYDPSDLTTMFQDTAGTVPVTAAGQTVALMLDKSLGLTMGSELRSTGAPALLGVAPTATFDTATGAATATTVTSINLSGVSFTGLSNRSYRVAVSVGSGSASSVRLRSGGLNGTAIADIPAGQSGTWTMVPTGGQISLTAVTDATTATFTVSSVRELPGNHATQATVASRPQYQIDTSGRPFLLFDGTDDWLLTPTITPGANAAQAFAGVRKLNDATTNVLFESSGVSTTNPGTIGIFAPSGAAANYSWRSQGSNTGISATATTFTAPITNVVTGIGDIAADTCILRVNGAQVGSTASDQGTGNYLAYPIYIGRRNGTSFPFNGRIYSLIVRFGANLSAAQIGQVEAWVNARTGAF